VCGSHLADSGLGWQPDSDPPAYNGTALSVRYRKPSVDTVRESADYANSRGQRPVTNSRSVPGASHNLLTTKAFISDL